MGDLTQITPPKDLSDDERAAVFQHVMRRLAARRNTAELYALAEYNLSALSEARRENIRASFVRSMSDWCQELLKDVWLACGEPGGVVPTLGPLSDTSSVDLPRLPDKERMKKLLNTVLFLNVTSSKTYSAHTRAFLSSFGVLDEEAVVATLKNPKHALEEAQRKTGNTTREASEQSKTLRNIGIGFGAVAGGVLIGVTGGLAAPLVGAGVTTILGWLGVGGTAAGLLASGLASSSVVCGALFGAYGSKRTADTVSRYLREVNDLAIVPVGGPRNTLAVRLCVSGWLDNPEDVIAPWSIFGGDDTFALRWEVKALEDLSNALTVLIKAQTMKYVRAEIIKRTVFASLFAALSPAAWLKLMQIIDNPWMTAKSLASKAGKVLGKLLAQRVLGNRPITLVGYSLGSIVIFEALQHLASLLPSQTVHLVQDVFIFGSPIPVDEAAWTAARRVVAGRFVNGYGSNDYILAVLSRLSNASWSVAGLEQVVVKGIENFSCDQVDGHLKWRTMIGQCLYACEAPDIIGSEMEKQLEGASGNTLREMEMNERDVDRVIQQGPVD
ncbi:uncharacterized protein FIBRA_04175 [Fibroporia radiculosa]|uniref:DUF726 domain-containing protein n=1 Tax=Fibroporia radiculosa TaxID=599839 RepID=J4G6Y5_9APHY|nr:uncharacterized protein FIBRA_04175 [Fibroporia radiculosa]CCM02098.1 predicted protein [Fibroporia radiculosa]